MKVLILVNDPAYGTERAFNSLRMAIQLGKDHANVEVRIFLLGDAASCAIPNQVTPNGYYNLERMLNVCLSKGAKVKVCGSCAEARGLKNISLIEGVELGTMAELAQWAVESEKVLTF